MSQSVAFKGGAQQYWLSMGVRPPDAGSDPEPEVIEFGIAAVDARLDETELSFPATADTVAKALGETEIPYDAHGRSIPIETALEETGKTEFTDRNELLNALHFVFEERRERSLGFIDRLRSLLPF